METNRQNGLINFQLSNFKSFSGTANFPIRPITLLFGPNSAGKSSFIKSLLLLKQSALYGNHGELLPTEKIIKLGHYKDIVYAHDTNREISFSLEFKPNLFLCHGKEEPSSSDYDDISKIVENDITEEDEDNVKLLRIINSYNNIRTSIFFKYNNGKIILSSLDLYFGDEDIPVFTLKYDLLSVPLSEYQFSVEVLPVFTLKYHSQMSQNGNSNLTFDKTIKTYNFQHSFWKLHWETFNDEEHNKRLIEQLNYFLSRAKEGGLLFKYLSDALKDIHSNNVTFEQAMALNVCEILFNSFELEKIPGIFSAAADIMFENYDFSENDNYSDFENFQQLSENIHLNKHSPVLITFLISKYLLKIFGNIKHIGPLRDFPKRYYELEKKDDDIKSYNSSLEHILFNQPNLRKSINEQLSKLMIPYEIQPLRDKSIPEREFINYWSIEFIDKRSGTITNFSDVGFGISQVLPIVLKCCLPNRERIPEIICIEQPELHLHPAMQAQIGDMFINTALKDPHDERSDIYRQEEIVAWEIHNKGYGRTIRPQISYPKFIIETHSEHLILRILRRIRETSEGTNTDTPPIYPEDVAVLYIKPGENGSEVFHIPVTADGDFECEWPDGFFEERDKELFSL